MQVLLNNPEAPTRSTRSIRRLGQRCDLHDVELDILPLYCILWFNMCVRTWARGQVERLSYFQSTLQILPSSLVHC